MLFRYQHFIRLTCLHVTCNQGTPLYNQYGYNEKYANFTVEWDLSS